MISYQKALDIIREQGLSKPLSVESVDLEEIAGRICAETVTAPMSNQPFDNSARDGYALRAEDLSRAVNDNPVILKVAGHIAAGDAPLAVAAVGQCYEIMTGAPVPPGCDAIVPVEQTEKNGGQVTFRSAVHAGSFIRTAGHDFSVGDPVLSPGAILEEGHILPLATLGVGQVEVRRRARVVVLSTGREIIDDLSRKLRPGEIYNSSGAYLKKAAASLGMNTVLGATIADDPAVYKQKLREAIDSGCDIIISTGAVSAGVHDFIPAVLKEMGAEILFHQVAVRPGRPILFARFGEEGPFFLGLPGNPVSSAAGLRFFVYPLLRAMQGLEPEAPKKAVLKKPYLKGNSKLFFFLRGILHEDYKVEIPQDQQSFMVSPFLSTDVWVTVPEDAQELQAGDTVSVYGSSV